MLTTPHPVSNEDIWIAIRFSHSGEQRTIGCDPGPASPNGDWLFDNGDGDWLPLTTRTGGSVDINWNIRGNVDPGIVAIRVKRTIIP